MDKKYWAQLTQEKIHAFEDEPNHFKKELNTGMKIPGKSMHVLERVLHIQSILKS